MNARAFYRDLKGRDVRLEADGENINIDAPAGVLTEADRTALKTHKAALLHELRSAGSGRAGVVCIHNAIPDACAVCSGYVRWLIEDEERLACARRQPKAAWQAFQSSRG